MLNRRALLAGAGAVLVKGRVEAKPKQVNIVLEELYKVSEGPHKKATEQKDFEFMNDILKNPKVVEQVQSLAEDLAPNGGPKRAIAEGIEFEINDEELREKYAGKKKIYVKLNTVSDRNFDDYFSITLFTGEELPKDVSLFDHPFTFEKLVRPQIRGVFAY